MTIRLHVTLGAAAALLLLSAGAVSAATPHTAQAVTVSANGTMSEGPYVIAHTSFSATRIGDIPNRNVTGTFTGALASLPATLRGPVTCLTVSGNTVSFVYPIDKNSSPSAVGSAGQAIQITVVRGVGGKPTKIGFLGPLPTALATSCAPSSVTPFTFTGTLRINGH